MKQGIVVVSLIALSLGTSSAVVYAQLGGGLLGKAQQAQDAKKKFDDLNISEEEERKIGEDVSAKIRKALRRRPEHGDPQYVTLVGTVLAQESERPGLAWRFIVLDTDGVNAFASPGGIIHVTRGALGLMKNEAELASVLAHEIGHVAHKHTVNAIRKNKAVPTRHERNAVESRTLPRQDREQGVRDGARERLRSRRRDDATKCPCSSRRK